MPGIRLETCAGHAHPRKLDEIPKKLEVSMLSIYEKIDRAQRLVRLLEDDAPLLAMRVAHLTPERQQAAKDFADKLTLSARAELERLVEERSSWENSSAAPQAAD